MTRLLLLLIILGLSPVLSADVRVLIRFDASGHHVHKLVHLPTVKQPETTRDDLVPSSPQATDTRRGTPINRSRSLVAATAPIPSLTGQGPTQFLTRNREFVTIHWFDVSGSLIAETFVTDPRIAHSPAHVQVVAASKTGFRTGAWLAIGPDSADNFSIYLPENPTLDLPAEVWQLSLKP